MASGGSRSAALVPKPESEGTKTAPGASRGVSDSVRSSAGVTHGTSPGTVRKRSAPRAGAVTRGEPFDLGVTRDDEHRADSGTGQRLEHVLEHGARQVSALRWGEEGDQPLLGVNEILDRNRHDHAHARASSVFLARAISPWRSRMTVSVKMGRVPPDLMRESRAASWLSARRMSSHGA